MSGVSAATIAVKLKGRIGALALDAAFTVPAQGVTALIGPSGGGKTSLLRCIAGLIHIDGEVRVGNETWQDAARFLAPHRRAVGYVFQEPSLFAHLSVRQNLMFGLKRHRAPPKIGLEEVITLLGVSALLKRDPARLSGGERQRVAIGRALLAQPRLLLMDEPLSSLDPDGKAEILPYLDQLHRSLSIPMIYVSHDPAEVARLADRTLVLREGRVVAPSPAALGPGMDEDAAQSQLGHLTDEQIARLAMAALMAGLAPVASENPDQR